MGRRQLMLLLAAGRGLPVTIHRPARILASTRTGACNPNDLHVRLAVGAVQLGSLPSGLNGVEYGAAVDHVAAAIVVLGLNAQRKGEYGSVFHVWERRPISAKALCSVLAVDYGLSVIQHDAWLEKLTQAASSNALGPLIHEVSGVVPVDFVPSFDSFTTTIAFNLARVSPIERMFWSWLPILPASPVGTRRDPTTHSPISGVISMHQ
jgi:thioester reductase-like protein